MLSNKRCNDIVNLRVIIAIFITENLSSSLNAFPLDRRDRDGVKFVLGYDANKTMGGGPQNVKCPSGLSKRLLGAIPP